MAKILLVEDDNNLREIYEARLQAEGYEIISAHDGEEALVVAKENKPDLIIADVMMPKISGFEMVDILRNTAGLQTVKIIMLTALGQTEDQDKAKSLGADRYLVKSQVTLEDIVNAAHDLLAGEGGAPADPAAATPATTDATAAPTDSVTPPVPSIPEESTPPATDTAMPSPDAIPAPEPAAPAMDATEPTVITPTPEATPAPTEPVTPPVDTNASVDNKLIDDAVTSLESTSSSSDDNSDTPTPSSTPTDPTASSDAPTTDTPTTNVIGPAQPSTDSGTAAPSSDPMSAAAPAADGDGSLEVSKGLEELLKKDNPPDAAAPGVDSSTSTSPSMDEASSSAPTPPPSMEDVPAPAPAEDTSGPLIESAPGSSMKVIKPIDSDKDKPDIKTLIEQEELNQGQVTTSEPAADAAATPPAPEPSGTQPEVVVPGGQTPAEPGTQVSPNDVAL